MTDLATHHSLHVGSQSSDSARQCCRLIGRRLWRTGIALALSIIIFVGGWQVRRLQSGDDRLVFGHDLLPSYTAGLLVRQGKFPAIYDRPTMEAYEAQEITLSRVDMDPRYGPWLNPPFYAWVFAPLSVLPYRQALAVFAMFNLALLALCFTLLRVMLIATPRAELHPSSFVLHPSHRSWTTLGLIPLLLATSMPFMQAFGHQQNTFISLTILCSVVAMWRKRYPFFAGMIAGLLAFKPQHALLIWAAMIVCLGWRAVLGIGVTGLLLLGVTLVTMPGSLNDFLFKLAPIVRSLQNDAGYNWGRQVTFQSFWRLLIQGDGGGPSWPIVQYLAWSCSGIVTIALIVAITRFRARRISCPSPDRIIAAIVVASPLIVPYYMDYDLVLLVIPAVLFAGEWLADPQSIGRCERRLLWAWAALFAATYVNPGFAREFHFNLTTPVLLVVAGLHILRCFLESADDVAMQGTRDDECPDLVEAEFAS